MVENLLAMREIWVQSLGQEDSLEEEMATHSAILAWKFSCTDEAGGLQSMGVAKSQIRLGARAHTHTHTYIYLSDHLHRS